MARVYKLNFQLPTLVGIQLQHVGPFKTLAEVRQVVEIFVGQGLKLGWESEDALILDYWRFNDPDEYSLGCCPLGLVRWCKGYEKTSFQDFINTHRLN